MLTITIFRSGTTRMRLIALAEPHEKSGVDLSRLRRRPMPIIAMGIAANVDRWRTGLSSCRWQNGTGAPMDASFDFFCDALIAMLERLGTA